MTHILGTAAAALLWFVGLTALAAEKPAALSDKDNACLACHSQSGLKKNLGKGATLSLHIQPGEFAQSVHAAIGCGGCHSDVRLEHHPVSKAIASVREYSIGKAEVCQGCHEDKSKLYEGSIHAALLRAGNRGAPVCTDCHNPHAVKPKSVTEAITGVACKKCHGAIFEAYAASIHGQARGKPGHVEAPICADCHRAHDISAASAGSHLRDACLGCHADAAQKHRAWLPNAGRHLEAVSCPACHAPTAQRRVDLRVSSNGSDRIGPEQVGEHARSASNGLDAETLWNLLREFNKGQSADKAAVQARLEVRTGVEAHQLADKSRAIRDCDSCHRDGADPFQTVIVSVLGPDGRPVRFGADKGVLNSLRSVDSVGDFYAIGGTRMKLLDVLLGMVFLGSLLVPVGHLTVKWLLRRRAAK